MKVRLIIVLGLSVMVLSGCFPKVKNLPAFTPVRAFAPLPEPDPNLLVGLAISGGGSRAAVFGAGVLEALSRTKVKEAGGERSVLEMVQYISSVSGGSLATAYYAALKPAKPDEEFFRKFKTAMQENFEVPAAVRQVMYFRAFNPSKFAHSLAEVWDSKFFLDMTFATLYEREKNGDSPRVILNGTSYNSGRRFVLTTLPAADFQYDFVNRFLTDLRQRSERMSPEGLAIIEKNLESLKEHLPRLRSDYDFVDRLLKDLRQRSERMSPEGLAIIEKNLESAKKHFLPLTFEEIGADHRELRLALGVASSASFPPVVGPVTYSVDGKPPYQHVGDGGLSDNLGTESLTTLFLKKIPRDSTKRGLIVVIDAAYPFVAGKPELDKNEKGFEVFKEDPSRIVGIMEERANAYQLMLWDALRAEGVVLPDFANLRIEILKHTEATWSGYQDLPEECRTEFPPDVTPESIREAVSQIPTLFRITKCHGALLIRAAQKVVERHRERIVQFIEK